MTSNLKPIFTELVLLRNRLYITLTHSRQRPADARELHRLLSATCVLLASISHDLGEPAAGMIQARAAETFADLSEDAALLTWVYCTMAMIASWWGRPSDVLHHAGRAKKAGLHGVGAIRLAGLQARAAVQLGRGAEADTLLDEARDRRERLDDQNTLAELGEVFSFPLPRQHYYEAATYVHRGDWPAAGREAAAVVELYDAPTGSECWPVTLALSRVYLAQARLVDAGPEGALDALAPVLEIPAEQRVTQLSQALTALRGRLRSPALAGSPSAHDLDEAIRTFQLASPGGTE